MIFSNIDSTLNLLKKASASMEDDNINLSRNETQMFVANVRKELN